MKTLNECKAIFDGKDELVKIKVMIYEYIKGEADDLYNDVPEFGTLEEAYKDYSDKVVKIEQTQTECEIKTVELVAFDTIDCLNLAIDTVEFVNKKL